MNSPCAMLMTPIWPKMIASPRPISRSTANRLRPAKPCIRPMLSMSEKVMAMSGGSFVRAARRGVDARGRRGAPRVALLVALRERIRLDQLGRGGDDLEGAV